MALPELGPAARRDHTLRGHSRTLAHPRPSPSMRPSARSAVGWSELRLSIGRCFVASGSRLFAESCLKGIECPLVLTPLCLRDDLEEHDHDDTGPRVPNRTYRADRQPDQEASLSSTT